MQSGTFLSPFLQFNGQLQTLIPGIFRKPKIRPYKRERFILSDQDFVDLDWLENSSKKLIILTHGLEGNSQRSYIKGMAKCFDDQKWDVLAWNCRSCSGELNLAPRLYHHGEVEDISEVIQHAIKKNGYEEIWLSGFSMGANISLNYLGKKSKEVPDQVKGAVVCSAPLSLHDGVKALHTKQGAFYRKRFFNMLSKKIKAKEQQYPGIVDISKMDRINHWEEFDRYFSAPIAGFSNEIEFYNQASPINFMQNITRLCLIVNAKNDPLLGPGCYPSDLIDKLDPITFWQPENGGHVGFSERNKKYSWFENVALEMIVNSKLLNCVPSKIAQN